MTRTDAIVRVYRTSAVSVCPSRGEDFHELGSGPRGTEGQTILASLSHRGQCPEFCWVGHPGGDELTVVVACRCERGDVGHYGRQPPTRHCSLAASAVSWISTLSVQKSRVPALLAKEYVIATAQPQAWRIAGRPLVVASPPQWKQRPVTSLKAQPSADLAVCSPVCPSCLTPFLPLPEFSPADAYRSRLA